MGFLARIVRTIFLFIFIAWVVWLARAIVRWLAARPGKPHPAAAPGPRQLHRDPVCGTHVAAEISFPLEEADRTLHFCSAECRERYVRSTRRVANA